MPGGDSHQGGSGGRTKVMDGSWNPRRVNCWPLYVRLGDTLALPWPRKSMHPFVFSRALHQPFPLYPPPVLLSSTYTTLTLCHHRRRAANSSSLYIYTHTHIYTLSLSLTPSLSSRSLFFGPQKGELGGVGDVRLLHYVFLTEPPLTSTLSHPLDPSSSSEVFLLFPSSLSPGFSCTLFPDAHYVPFRVSPSA